MKFMIKVRNHFRCVSALSIQSFWGAVASRGRVVQKKETGSKGTFLIELSDYSIEETLLLINQNLNFELRHNGPKLKPLALQPKEVIKTIEGSRAISKVAETTSEEVEFSEILLTNFANIFMR